MAATAASCGSSDTTTTSADVVINEVFVKSAVAGNDDWIELFNKGDTEIDLNGWTLKDAKEREAYSFGGTRIAAGAFLVISRDETGTSGFTFGLGNADMVRLSDPSGELVDRVEWEDNTKLEDKSLGRLPDGALDLAILSEPTKGATNKP